MFFTNKTLLALVLIGLSLSQPGANASGQTVLHSDPHYPVAIQNNSNPLSVRQDAPAVVFLKENMHEVVPGDNTWNIASDIFYSGYKWRDLVAQNKFLQQPGRVYYDSTKNWWYCMIHTGEQLVTYQPVQPNVEVIHEDTASGGVMPPVPGPTGSDMDWSFLWWVFFFFFFLFLILFFLKGKQWQNSNPTNAGPPQVPNGIHDVNAVDLMASRARAQVLSIRKGKLYGKGKASYNFSSISLSRILNDIFGQKFDGEVGYEAQVVMPGGKTKTVYCLQACGNDVRQGNFVEGITFIPDTEQPAQFTTHNAKVESENAKASDKEENAAPEFNWQQKTLEIIEKAVDNDKKIFFEITTADGSKFKFDSLNEPSGPKGKKPSVQDTGDRKA